MCHIPKGDMPLELVWFFNGRPLLKSHAVIVTKMGVRSSILAISAATEKHSGNYTCTASNTVASTNHTATLNVQGTLVIFYVASASVFFCLSLSFSSLKLVSPHIVPFEAADQVFAGESVQLTCHVSKGDAPLRITWSFHGKELSSHQGISTMKIGDRTSLLTIASATSGHSGEYSCHAANNAGIAVHSAVVNVHGTSTLPSACRACLHASLQI